MELSTKEFFSKYVEPGDFIIINTEFSTMIEPDEVIGMYEKENEYIIEMTMIEFNFPNTALWELEESSDNVFICNELGISVVI